MFNIFNLFYKKIEKETNPYTLDVDDFTQKLTNFIDNKEVFRKILKEKFHVKSVDILFLNIARDAYIDTTNKLNIAVKFLDYKSVLGNVFIDQNIFFTLDIKNEKRYNITIDNPFNIEFAQQIIIPIVGNNKVEGFIRFNGTEYSKASLSKIYDDLKKLHHIFRDMYLYDFNQKMSDIASSPFKTKSRHTYHMINNMRERFIELKAQAQHPEVEKLVDTGIANLDTIFEYINPNLENVSCIKNAMFQIDEVENKGEYKVRILLVDDVQLNLKILNAMLVYDWVEEIYLATNGIEGLEKIESSIKKDQYIDILFLDHHMPGMLGLEVAEYLHEKAKNTSSYNVIIVSITNDPEAIENKQNLYDYHLSKPFSRTDVESIMKEIKNKKLDVKSLNKDMM